MKIVTGLRLLRASRKTTNMQSYLTASQIRACTYPHRERPTEKDTLSRGPHMGGNASTPRNSTAARLPLLSWARKVSSFLQLKIDHHELYEDAACPYQHGMCSEQSFFHPQWLTCVTLSFWSRACIFKTAGQGLGCILQLWQGQGTCPPGMELMLST